MTSLRDLVLAQRPGDASALRAIHDWAEAHDGDVTDLPQALAAWWDAAALERAAKIDAVAWAHDDLEARAAAQREAARRLTEAAERCERATERIRAYVLQVLREAGARELHGETRTLRVVRNGGAVPLEVSADASELPAQYRRTETRLVADRAAIRAALEAGEEIPGCRLGERGERVVVR